MEKYHLYSVGLRRWFQNKNDEPYYFTIVATDKESAKRKAFINEKDKVISIKKIKEYSFFL